MHSAARKPLRPSIDPAWAGRVPGLAALQAAAKTAPNPIGRVFIPKRPTANSARCISTLRDRACMTAAMLGLEPIFEADLPPEQCLPTGPQRPAGGARGARDAVPRSPGSRGRGPRGLLRLYSTRLTDAVARAAHHRCTCAASAASLYCRSRSRLCLGA
jgi:hypothetical protein